MVRVRLRSQVILRDTGVTVHAGVGSGLVSIVQSNEDMADFPDGGVLVTRYTAPWLARIVPKAAPSFLNEALLQAILPPSQESFVFLH